MKAKQYSRKLAMIVAICLLMTGTALASIVGQLIDGYDVYLGAGMELSKGVYWTGSDYRTENYVEYSPNSDVYPVVVSGSKVCNYGSFSSMAALLENQGKHVIAGVNGDYYVMANYMPLGIVVENGVLRTSDAGHWAVGFKSDGSAIFGRPSLSIHIEINGTSYKMDSFNKTRNAAEAVIFTDDFAQTTKNTDAGYDIVCNLSGTPSVNSQLTMTVEKSVESSGAMTLPAGKAVISVSKKAGDELLSAVSSLNPGDSVKLKISCASGWENVSYAIGSLYKLVTNGQVESGLQAGAGPRTAVGMKADGTLVFYTMDGRQTGHSVGVSMTQLAERMIELGCVEATIMDGGGSTSMNAIYLGDSSASQINSPSDGGQRSVTNYIMLVTDKKATGTADRLALYPLSTNVLSGAAASFTLKAADANGYSAKLETPVTLSVSDNLGTIGSDGSFRAAGAGRGSIIAQGEGLIPASVNINVVETPDILRVYHEGKTTQVTSLSVYTDSKTALMAQAMHDYVYLISQDNCYTWSVTGNIGSIDSQGNFTASTTPGTGTIAVQAGERSVSIPVTVTSPDRYSDVKSGSWYYNAVEYVSEKGLMQGTGDGVFAPNDNASRAMIVTVIHRMNGAPAPASTGGFTDVASGGWYSNAVYWAREKGIVEGYGSTFGPNDSITREQLAAMLYRQYGSPSVSGSLSAYSDAGQVSDWAKTAMIWAVEKGVITGTTGGSGSVTLSPRTAASRAEVAMILMRLQNV